VLERSKEALLDRFCSGEPIILGLRVMPSVRSSAGSGGG
jgi:hypothetical protein